MDHQNLKSDLIKSNNNILEDLHYLFKKKISLLKMINSNSNCNNKLIFSNHFSNFSNFNKKNPDNNNIYPL